MPRHRETPTWVPVTQDTLRNLQPGMIAGEGLVSSFNTRTGAITLLSGDVIAALGYTPAPTTADEGQLMISIVDMIAADPGVPLFRLRLEDPIDFTGTGAG